MAHSRHRLDWHTHPPADPLLQQWLFDQESLTRRLRVLSSGDFSVQLVRQGWQCLRPDECHALGCLPEASGWVREVFLCGGGQPWIYARSVASRAALEAGGLDLASLGTRSLGELLFADAAFNRGSFEICQVPAAYQPPALQAVTGDAQLWARRSCFSRAPLQILVAEAFLPAFWQRLKTNPVD